MKTNGLCLWMVFTPLRIVYGEGPNSKEA